MARCRAWSASRWSVVIDTATRVGSETPRRHSLARSNINRQTGAYRAMGHMPYGPERFFRIAFYFEGSLALIAVLIGWLVGISPVQHLSVSASAVLWGVLGTLPMFALFVLFYRIPVESFRQIRDLLLDTLGPNLAACSWAELLLLASVAGFSEELLFRGLLQPWIESAWGWAAGLIGSNLLFGLAHCVTPLYAVVAAGIGVYLGLVLDAGEERNLLTPIIIHGLYDFLAFLVVVQTFRSTRSQ